MTQNKPPRCLLITHAELGRELLAAVKQILGEQTDVITISNRDLGLQQMLVAVEDSCSQSGETFLFSDFKGGSCDLVARKTAVVTPERFCISGVNLAMLLSFFTKRSRLSGAGLQKIVAEAGIRGIQI